MTKREGLYDGWLLDALNNDVRFLDIGVSKLADDGNRHDKRTLDCLSGAAL